ncbi:MAG TPA: L-threonylcarbamoyladenylate synthase [Rhizomicrobium sp.]|nr:L-threonylcarbamoyladenylate synthase [Rhizomicrobium sp.]
MTTVLPRIRPADAASIEAAAKILRKGGLVAFPTETVYGLGADATNDLAVASIFAAKERPKFNPLIVHVHDLVEAKTLAEFSPLARKLALKFWPGGLTLVLPRKPDAKLSLLASAGLDTIALRVPANAIARKLLAAAERPIAAPSANRSGQVSPTTAAHVADGLQERVDFILDGGPAKLGIESTIIGFENGKPVLLRPGAIPREAIEEIAGPLAKHAGDAISAPGQLESHYAPHARVRLNAVDVKPGEALLAFGPDVPTGAKKTRNLSPFGDLTEAAANLFAMLRELDAMGASSIAVMPVPEHGLGEAINDRLMRAAATRGAS